MDVRPEVETRGREGEDETMSAEPITRPEGLRPTFHSIAHGGLDWESLAMRLYTQGNDKAWNPRNIDFSQDAEHWSLLDEDQQRGLLGIVVMFLAGEESVTEDIAPFMKAMSDEGRLEEEMYLTQFALEEAKHTEAFRRFLDAIGVEDDLHDVLERTTPSSQALGGVFADEQPAAMRRLWTDSSPRAQIRANVVYNQFVEGTMALTGYWIFTRLGEAFEGLFPGIREVIRLISRDERRHLAWGTYNIRRHVAEDDAMWDAAKADLDEMMEKMTVREQQRRAEMTEEERRIEELGTAIGIGPDQRWAYQVSRLERRYGAIESARGASREEIERIEAGADEEGYDALAR
jgi:ribonucleoside-diphosphate reductase beta chain